METAIMTLVGVIVGVMLTSYVASNAKEPWDVIEEKEEELDEF